MSRVLSGAADPRDGPHSGAWRRREGFSGPLLLFLGFSGPSCSFLGFSGPLLLFSGVLKSEHTERPKPFHTLPPLPVPIQCLTSALPVPYPVPNPVPNPPFVRGVHITANSLEGALLGLVTNNSQCAAKYCTCLTKGRLGTG